MTKKFSGLLALVMLLCALCSSVWAKTPREAVVDYAYEIYNYTWTTNNSVPRYHADSYPYTVTGTIKGIPYTYSNMISFEAYKALSPEDRETMYSGSAKYGMVCATLVTDCIRQGFPDKDLPVLNMVMFHKTRNSNRYNNLVSSVSSAINNYDHPTPASWQSIWTNIRTSQENSGYPAYKKLQKGDYLNDWNHVILVVENDTSAQKITYIDQTSCWDTVSNGMVGTHKGTYTYSRLSEKCYVPMYVDYPSYFTTYYNDPPTITTTSLPDAYIGEPYYAKIETTGTTPITFYGGKASWLSNGFDMQEMLVGSDTTGIIKGIPGYRLLPDGTREPLNNTPPYTLSATFTATNSAGSASKTLSITIRERPKAPTITTTSLPDAYIGEPYCAKIETTGTTPITFYGGTSTTLANGIGTQEMLIGLDTTGVIKGTPKNPNNRTLPYTLNFPITAKNSAGSASKTLYVTVRQKPKITTTSLPTATYGIQYSAPITIEGGTTPITWTSSGLPSGLSLSSSTGRTVYITGKPSTYGRFLFTVTATDSLDNKSTQSFNMAIMPPFAFGSDSSGKQSSSGNSTTGINMPSSSVRGQNYTGYATVSGGLAPYTWSYSGAIPAGTQLTYSGNKATISGKITAAGKYNFTLRAKDANRTEITKSFTVEVTQTTPSGTVPALVVGAPANFALTASGGTAPYTWELNNKLPDGLTLASNGRISGTPKQTANSSVTVKVTDSNGISATKSFTFKVTRTTFTGNTTSGTVKGAYSAAFDISGGTPPYKAAISGGSLPPGLTMKLSGTRITISGTPTKAGKYSFTLKVTDKNNISFEKNFSITITQPGISSYYVYNGIVKAVYNAAPSVSGGAAPYTWDISNGSLPPGLNINKSTGKITGTPTKAGKYTFTLRVKDKNGVAATREFTITITQTTVSGTLSNGIVKAAYNKTLTASEGTAPYTWGISNGSLPPGLSINKTNGKISGTPTKAGTYTFTVRAKDKNGVAGQRPSPSR